MGHLHPGCAKDIVVTMKSDVPINLKKMGVKCKISKIMFALPADQVPDWDDRMRTVKWIDVPRNTPGTFTTKRKVSRSTKPLVWPGPPCCHVQCLIMSLFHGKKKQSPFTWPGFPKWQMNFQAWLLPSSPHIPHKPLSFIGRACV